MAALRFNLLGFPVEIQPGFWLIALLLGLGVQSVTQMSIWVGVVLVSVLVHELGHASLARAYGQQPRITLHMMGGLTSWTPNRELGQLRRILVTLAGPMAGLALGALALTGAVLHQTAQAGLHAAAPGGFFATAMRVAQGHYGPTMLGFALGVLAWVNVVWSGINLLPVLPFDGGQILAAALGQKRHLLAATLSLVFGLVLAAFFVKIGYMYAALIFALGAGSSYMQARQPRRVAASPAMLAQVLTAARAALSHGEHAQARAMSKAVADATQDPEMRRQALDLSGWAAVMSGDAHAARDTLRDVRPTDRFDPFLEGAIHHVDGDLDRAAAALSAAREAGDPRPELAGLLVRVLLENGRFAPAAELAGELIDTVDEAEIRRVAHEALNGGACDAAGRLFERLFEHTDASEDAFDAARAYARADRRDEAFVLLGRAIDKGEAPERARLDADLGRLNDDARFEPALDRPARPTP